MDRPWEVALDKKLSIYLKERNTFIEGPDGADLDDDDAAVQAFHERESRVLRDAEPFYVTTDVIELIAQAAESFEYEELLPSDLLVKKGFAYFEGEGVVPMLSGEAPDGGPWADYMAAIAWEASESDLQLWVYTDQEHFTFGNFTWTWGERRAQSGGDSALVDEGQARWTNVDWHNRVQTFFQVFARLARQQFMAPEPQRVQRGMRRQAARLGSPSDVVVVRLRRRKQRPPASEQAVEWSHRWPVSGHWRNQWYPSLATHRQKWINTYVKGPEDKELVVKPRAFLFDR